MSLVLESAAVDHVQPPFEPLRLSFSSLRRRRARRLAVRIAQRDALGVMSLLQCSSPEVPRHILVLDDLVSVGVPLVLPVAPVVPSLLAPDPDQIVFELVSDQDWDDCEV